MVFEESREERITRESHKIRDKIINYVRDNIKYATEDNMEEFLRKQILPAEFYNALNKSPEHFVRIIDCMPKAVSESLKYNNKKYYSKTKQGKGKAKEFKKCLELVYR